MRTYVPFLDDEVLESAVQGIINVYHKSYREKTLEELQKNIIDPFKFYFDTTLLYNGDSQKTMEMERIRQSDKSINNAIGTFHEKLLGNLPGFELTPDLPTDIKKKDLSVFAEVKNKYNTMNARSQTAVYDELFTAAKTHPKAICYLIEVISQNPDLDELWTITTNGEKRSHPQIRVISAKQFYARFTGIETAFVDLFHALPDVIRHCDVKSETSEATPSYSVSIESIFNNCYKKVTNNKNH
jgi:hypothetical protein